MRLSPITLATFCTLALTASGRAQNAAAQNAAAQDTATWSTPIATPPATQLNTFVRGVYWPWERTAWPAQNAGMDVWEFSDRVLRELKERYHCDLIWVVNIGGDNATKLAGLAAKYGIGVTPVATAIYDWRGVRTQRAADAIAKQTASTLGSAAGIAGYVLLDEPKRGEVESLETTRAALAKLDPHRPALVVSMLRQTEAVARRTKLPFLVSDPYSFFGPDSPNGPNTPATSRAYYLNATQRTVALARETGKTAWIMPQIFTDVWGDWHYDDGMNVVAEPGASLHWRMPTVGETRWQIWQAIGAGAKGVVFYVLFPTRNPRRRAQDAKDMEGYRVQKPYPNMPKFETEQALHVGTAILRNDGTSTPQGEAMGEVFAAIEPHRELLQRLEPAPPLAFAGAPLRATTFHDPQNDKTYVVVVNDNTEAAVTGKVRFLPNIQSARELITKSDITTRRDETSGLAEVSISIEAGSGALLALDDVSAVPTYVEDFGIQISAGQFERVQRVLVPIAWGMGYRVAVKTQPDAATVRPQQAAADVADAPGAAPEAAPEDAAAPGRLEYRLSQVAGAAKRMGGRLFLIYSGSPLAGKKNVEVTISSDGKEFRSISTDEFEQPVAIPLEATHLRFTLLNARATLDGWQLIATP